MPNWCENKLVLKNATAEEIQKFEAKYFSNGVLSLNNVIPIPESEMANWYNWRIENWGTKWDISPLNFQRGDEGVYFFDTAWSPAKKIYEKIIDDNTHLKFEFTYLELGLFFCGGIQSHPNVGSVAWYSEDDRDLMLKTASEAFGYDPSDFEEEGD